MVRAVSMNFYGLYRHRSKNEGYLLKLMNFASQIADVYVTHMNESVTSI